MGSRRRNVRPQVGVFDCCCWSAKTGDHFEVIVGQFQEVEGSKPFAPSSILKSVDFESPSVMFSKTTVLSTVSGMVVI